MPKHSLKKPELLAPAQDWTSLRNITGLADAIYFGVKNYNMRAKAKNFERGELKEIAKFCHHQKPPLKAYLATNILIYDSELQDLEKLILEAKKAGIDAIIAHDLAVIKFAKREKLDIGAERIILARELSLKQIKLIKHHLTKTQIECFVHGSMCTSISGRCYLSATICDSEEFSANRGNCVQPCRREWRVIDDENNELIYDGQMFLNAKDLCMIEYIPELIKANINVFKIEGRMKNPLYIETVTKCYREAIDSYFENTFSKEKVRDWLKRLAKVYNRGFHTGFYFHRPTIEDVELERRGNVSPYRKHYLGKVLSFNTNSMTANILIEIKEFNLKIGDEIIVIGNETYHHQNIKHMVFKGEKIQNIYKKRYDNPFKVNLRLSNKVQIDDKVYIIYQT